MSTANLVKFWCNTRAAYDAIVSKDPSTVYFCKDSQEIFRGEVSYSGSVKIVTSLPDLMRRDTLYIIQSGENAGGYVYPMGGSGHIKVINGSVFTGGGGGGISIEDIPMASPTTDGLMASADYVALKETVTKVSTLETDVEQLKSSTPLTIEESNDPLYAKVYTFKQGSDTIGAVNIPKDLVVKSGVLEDVAADSVLQNGSYLPAGKYIVLTISNDAEDKIYISVGDLGGISYTAGDGIEIEESKIKLKAVLGNGLKIESGALKLDLATPTEAGALSAEDKVKIDSLPKVYMQNKYSVTGLPAGCLTDIKDHEIRIFCPSTTQFTVQNVGEGGNTNYYYYGVKMFVPDNTVYIEHAEKSDFSDAQGELFETRVTRGFAGYEDGRKYVIVWFPAAKTTDGGATWTYFGETSGATKIGNNSYLKCYSDSAHTVLSYYDVLRLNLENENSWNKPIDHYSVVKSVNATNGLTLSAKGELGFDSSTLTVVDKDGASSPVNDVLEEIYKSIVWNETDPVSE